MFQACREVVLHFSHISREGRLDVRSTVGCVVRDNSGEMGRGQLVLSIDSRRKMIMIASE